MLSSCCFSYGTLWWLLVQNRWRLHLRISEKLLPNSPFCVIPFHVFLSFFLCPFFWIRRKNFFWFWNFMLSNPIIERIIHGESEGMEFLYQSSTRYLLSERSDFPHLASYVETWNSKMVNLGKEIENDKNLNEMKLGPSMNIFRNFDPYTTLDPFYPKQWLQKRSNI